MDGTRWLAVVLQFTIASLTGCACFPKHGEAPPMEPASVLVSGMVKTPGKIVIPNGGLTLRDALALTGGDNPQALFKISPILLLVTLERPDGIYNFSLPLVTDDDAGKIYLAPGDRIVVQPWYQTDLSRLSKPTPDDATIFSHQTEKEAMLPLLGVADKPSLKKLDFKITISQLGANAREIMQQYAWPAEKTNPIPTAGTLHSNWRKHIQDKTNYSPAQTVLILRRVVHGRASEFYLPRQNPRYISTSEADVADVLNGIVLLPNDNLSIDILQRQPIVLSSLLAPHLHSRARQKERQECLPQVHDTFQDARNVVHTVVAPIGEGFSRVNAIVGTPLQNVSDSLMTPFRR
jgi:hypothetical protein